MRHKEIWTINAFVVITISFIKLNYAARKDKEAEDGKSGVLQKTPANI